MGGFLCSVITILGIDDLDTFKNRDIEVAFCRNTNDHI
jgi:hypothetical protein